MEHKWLILIPFLFLIGCGTQPVKTRTETVEVVKPILYCPAPEYEALGRPQSLPFSRITDNTSVGEVAVLYKASVRTLLDYIDRLEQALAQYEEFNKSYDELVEELNLPVDKVN